MPDIWTILFLFFIYGFCGWLIEISNSLIREHKFVNRGFLIGPILPIYGIGGVLIAILLDQYKNDPLVLYIMSLVLCSILEYTTSYIMEVIFKNRWWDYSYMRFNINGRICLETMVPFGFFAMLVVYIVNPFTIKIYNLINPNISHIILIILIIIFIIDLILSFNIIINLKNISNSIRSDSTEAITKKVKEILETKTKAYRRLLESFPNMKVFNKTVVLSNKIKKDKNKLKQEKQKIRIKKRVHK